MLVRVKKGGRAKHERKTSTYPDLFYFVAFELTFELELTVDLRHQCLVHFFFRVEAVQSQCEVSAFFPVRFPNLSSVFFIKWVKKLCWDKLFMSEVYSSDSERSSESELNNESCNKMNSWIWFLSSFTLKNNFKDLFAVFLLLFVCFAVNQRCGGQPGFCVQWLYGSFSAACVMNTVSCYLSWHTRGL